MNPAPDFLIDSDVLITAKNRYYAFSICPGFWDSLLHFHSLGRAHSIDRVRQELLQGRSDDDLAQWVSQSVPTGFFLECDASDVVDAFTEVMLWVTRHAQYQDEAKAKFATGADGWLVAFGRTSGKVVVTNEQPRPESRSQIKLPDVCDAFSVKYEDTFAMLRKLNVSYQFAAP
ncbi:MAG: DUF4411 family protein [Gammaproteobacteria bacterium]|nr:DUF4411 family protein [Boseongicola sp. SB0667_bin_21]MYE84728.1 DUF4411 family protein [Gammaproteobacteria bacterium]